MAGSEEQKKSKERDADAGPSPCSKKLRISDPDLQVIVKYKDKEGKVAKKIYPMYSQILARLSNFFDTSLSVAMKEKASREIVFENVTPDIFEKALKYQQDPLAIRSMTKEDAVELVEFYDKYEFVGGLELCDDILSKYFLQYDVGDPKKSYPDNLDMFVRAIAIAKVYNLPKATMYGVAFLKADFESDPESPFGDLHLNTAQLTILLPFFKEKILRLPEEFTAEDVSSPHFIKFYLKCRSTHFLSKMLQGFQLKNHKTGWSTTNTTGGLKAQGSWDKPKRGYTFVFEKDQTDDCWVFKSDKSSTIFLKCPGSGEFDYPPRGPWLTITEYPKGGTFQLIRYGGTDS